MTDFRRSTLPLDGIWAFAPDENNDGHHNDNDIPLNLLNWQDITVPGCWQAQNRHCQAAWYRRTAAIPQDWDGRRIRLKIGGASYTTNVWLNDRHAVHHEGILLPFDADVTTHVIPGATNEVTVHVKQFDYPGITLSEQLGDALLGLFGGWTTWGGLYGSVEFEATAPAWITNVFLKPDIDAKQVIASVCVRNDSDHARRLVVGVRIQPLRGGEEWQQSAFINLPANGELNTRLTVPIPNAHLWEPDDPFLYEAYVTLQESSEPLDAVVERFGMRKIEVEGRHIRLNDRPIFLRGALLDAVYPKQISPTLSEGEVRELITALKHYGFNFVRHHTHAPPSIFHRVADELGLMQLEEFASFGSIGNPRLDLTQRTRRDVRATWKRMIERDRNHPSIIAFGVNNECWHRYEFLAWAATYRDLYDLAKDLDGTRLVIDNSGGEDHWSVASDVFDKHTYHFPTDKEMSRLRVWSKPYLRKAGAYFNVDLTMVDKPCLVTEVGGWCTFPDHQKTRAACSGELPWWLSRDPVRNPRMSTSTITRIEGGMADAGLKELYPIIVANSERFAAMGNKLQIEQMRQTPGIAGYAYCTFMDCYNWTCGLVDNYLQPKSFADAFAQHNQASVLLWPRERWCFWAGERVDATIILSHYGHQPLEGACLKWELLAGENVLLQGDQANLRAACYCVQDLASITITMPSMPQAAKLSLRVTLQDRHTEIRNHWDVWVFSRPAPRSDTQQIRLLDPAGRLAALERLFPFAEPLHPGQPIRADVLLTSVMTEDIIAHLQEGGRVVWFERGDELNCRPYSLHPQVDYHATLVNIHPALGTFPHEGWCDMQFHNLMGNAVLDTGYFESNRLTPIIEAFQVPFETHVPRIMPFRRKGFLAEAQIDAGRLLMTTFEFDHADERPEAATMVCEWLSYLLNPTFVPGANLSADELREWIWGSPNGPVETNFVEIGYSGRRQEHSDVGDKPEASES